MIREESLQIIDRPQKSIKSDNDNNKLQVINVIDENKDINKKHTVKNKSDLLNKMSDDNILLTKNLLQNRKIFNYMKMIIKKIIWEQFICGKFYTIKSNKNKFIIQPHNRSFKNIKITMLKEYIFIRKEKNLEKLERSVEINIDSNQIMIVLSIIQKNINRNSYISIFDNKISSYTLFNKRILIYILMMKWDI